MKKGFTLIEVLVYVFVFGVLIVGIVSFALFLMNVRTANQVVMDVNRQGVQVISIITQSVRNADSFSIDSGELTTDTTFSLQGGVVYSDNTALTNDNVLVESLVFTSSQDTVQIKLDINGRSFYGAATLR